MRRLGPSPDYVGQYQLLAVGDGNIVMTKTRLDQALVARGLVRSRSRAADLIGRGKVKVGGGIVDKAAAAVGEHDLIEVFGDGAGYVSRGALKLLAALDQFRFDPAGATAIDVGASTGGFTEVLLKRGAAKVFAIDVGHSQLHPSLRGDPRVVCLEGTDARRLDRTTVGGSLGAIVADVSFISLMKALPAALEIAAPGAWLAALVKPQFEVGRAAIGKGGIVRDEAARSAAVENVVAWLGTRPGWRIEGFIPSPIVGGSGNIEYLLGARFDG